MAKAEVLEVMAPAKINLTLEILARMEGGFHRIRSVAQTINICDTIRFRTDEGSRFVCRERGWSASQSLIGKTVNLLRHIVGCSLGILISVDKRIPLLSGLGGDSSDAAATLLGLNRFWGLGLTRQELLDLAARLGSDVPFFLHGGTCLLENKGERVIPLAPFPHSWVVLLNPPVVRFQGKTERLYNNIKAENYTDGEATDRLIACLKGSGNISSSCLLNVFDDAAPHSFPGLEFYRKQFQYAGADEVHLSGSGPILYSLVKERVRGEKIQRSLEKLGIDSYLTDTRDRSGDIMKG